MRNAEVIRTGTRTKKTKHGFLFRTLGISGGDSVRMVRAVRAGFPYKSLANFQKTTALPWGEISRFVAITPRTLTRRQHEGRLQPDESDRVWRAANLFDRAIELFEGDIAAAGKWMQTAQAGLGGDTPLTFASTEVGSREVEQLIGRLEHGVFT